MAKISVMLMLSPAAMHSSIAGMPSVVAGILMKRFGRSIFDHHRFASSIVGWVSNALSGETSMLTKPSPPPDAS
jgi:hypothetical protein